MGWEQEDPNHLTVYRYERPRERLGRGQDKYLSAVAGEAARLPPGHPEGFIECFADIYCVVVAAIRAALDGKPMKSDEYDLPTVHDGLRGMRFITRAVEPHQKGSVWVRM